MLRVITIFSPLRIFLPIAAASFAVGAGYGSWTIVTQTARHQLVGAAHHARRDRVPRRPRVGADRRAAVRWPQVVRPAAIGVARRSAVRDRRARPAAPAGVRVRLLDRRSPHARRARVSLARAQPRRRPRIRLRRRSEIRAGRSVRPRARLSAVSGARRRRREASRRPCPPASRSRRRSSARLVCCSSACSPGVWPAIAPMIAAAAHRRVLSPARLDRRLRVQRSAVLAAGPARGLVRSDRRRTSVDRTTGPSGGRSCCRRPHRRRCPHPAGDAVLRAARGRPGCCGSAGWAPRSRSSSASPSSSRRGRSGTTSTTVGSCSSPPKAA